MSLQIDSLNDEVRLARLLEYLKAEGRVCPIPPLWNKLWELLPGRHKVEGTWEPQPPLILAAWWVCSAKEKQDRLELHMKYAAEHGVLDQVEQFLFRLNPKDWVYGNGT